jgi:hypothetical protein
MAALKMKGACIETEWLLDRRAVYLTYSLLLLSHCVSVYNTLIIPNLNFKQRYSVICEVKHRQNKHDNRKCGAKGRKTRWG